MDGLRHLKRLMGEDFAMVVSDTTGAFPNEDGLDERLAFVFDWTVVNRKELVTDVTYDRSKVIQTIARHSAAINQAVADARSRHAAITTLMERLGQDIAEVAGQLQTARDELNQFGDLAARRDDVAAGGHGAPLAPVYHLARAEASSSRLP